jgi:hypothetical protein
MLKTMDPDLIRQMLEGHTDVLTGAAEAEEALYRNTCCPVCGEGECQKVLREAKVVTDEDGRPEVVQSPFGSGPLPEGYAHCIHCDTDFNPRTGMIFNTAASMIHAPE